MKNGIASSTKLSMPRAICCAKMTPGNVPSTQMKISAASASANPIGSPPNSVMKNPISVSVSDDGTDQAPENPTPDRSRRSGRLREFRRRCRRIGRAQKISSAKTS